MSDHEEIVREAAHAPLSEDDDDGTVMTERMHAARHAIRLAAERGLMLKPGEVAVSVGHLRGLLVCRYCPACGADLRLPGSRCSSRCWLTAKIKERANAE